LPITLSPCLLLPVSYYVNVVVKLKHLVYNFGCPRLVRLLFCIISLVLPEHVCGVSVI
jgi:hypothetical protein